MLDPGVRKESVRRLGLGWCRLVLYRSTGYGSVSRETFAIGFHVKQSGRLGRSVALLLR